MSEYIKRIKKLFIQCKNIETLNNLLNDYKGDRYYYIFTQVLMSKLSLFDLFNKMTLIDNNIKKIENSKEFAIFEISRNYGRKNIKSIKETFAIIKSSFDHVYYLFSITTSDSWRSGILWFLSYLSPKVNSLFLKQKEIKELLENLSKSKENIELRLTKIVSKGRTPSKEARMAFDSDIHWTDSSINEAFIQAKEQNRWFKSIDFELVNTQDIKYQIMKGQLSKFGYIMCNSNFKSIREIIINKMGELGYDKIKTLLNRSRKFIPDYKTKPLFIDYESDIFAKKENNKLFIDRIKKLKYSSCSIIHGNPYIHLSLSDHRDGSSYDLWILNPKRILIIPQIKASEGSLSRLIQHIFEEFREGSVISA